MIPFAASRGRVRRDGAADTEARGAILLFTGVRYERLDAESPAAPRRGSSPKRPRRGR